MKKSESDCVVIHDRAQRRRFIRRGASFVALVGAANLATGRQALASECDRGGSGEKKPEHAGNGSDSDTGASADPTGCGRNYNEKPKISRADPLQTPSEPKSVTVGKIVV